jgi:hypothetical protein
MFQTSVAGQILVVGDVDTGVDPANEPGATWVIKPRISTTGALTRWESHVGPRGPDPAEGDIWHDSHYDTSILMHDLQFPDRQDDRILMFGGSRFNGTAWEVNNTIWEFEPSGTVDPVVLGTWKAKRTDTQFERIFANAVILPTGEIFIEGGDKRDTFDTHQGGPSVPVYDPVIYDPGIDKDDPGMLYPQDPDAVLMPRLYHHAAVLLPDASVFIAGGQRRKDAGGSFVPSSSSGTEPDPRFNGEIFYPPYFNSGRVRPVIMSWQSDVSFSDDLTLNEFTIQVDKNTDGTIDSIVLLRPAAITHHFDNDQRFVELEFSQEGLAVPGDPGRELVMLDVKSPHEKLGPPGYYLLFAIEAHNGCTGVQGHRVPTRAKFIQIL